MTRSLHTDTSSAMADVALSLVFFIRLDIVGDPILAWTGFGDYAFGAGATGDAAMDGQTFLGITHLIGEVGTVTDAEGGSSALELTLPGVDLTDEALRQVVYNKSKWQYRQAWVWMAFLDASGNVIGRPFRIKSGRMDRMPVAEDDSGVGSVKCVIESQQVYAGEALGTRYSEQDEIDPNDTSQSYTWSLANMTPALGQANATAGVVGGMVGAMMDSSRAFNMRTVSEQ